MWEVCNICRVKAARIQNATLWRKKNHQLDKLQRWRRQCNFFSGGESVWSVEFKSPWSSTLHLVPLESSDGDGDFDTLSNVGGGDRNPEWVTDIDCTSGVPDRLLFNFSVRSFAAKVLVNARVWAWQHWQVAWNIYSLIKIRTQKYIILLDSILPNPVFVVL